MRSKTKILWIACATILLVGSVAGQTLTADASVRLALSLVFQWSVVAALAVAVTRLAGGWLREIGYRKTDLLRIAMVLLVAAVAGVAFIRFFFHGEQDIKIYDSTVYWIRVIENRQILADSVPKYLLLLRQTFEWEYNHLAAFPLIPLSYLLGIDFSGFCLSIFFVYYLPSCLFLTVLALRLFVAARGTRTGMTAFIACFGACVLSPALLWPVMNGYLDVVGVLVMAVLLNYSLRWDGVDFSVRRNIILALLSLLLILARRYYGFYIVGFYVAVGLVAVVGMVAGRRFSAANLGRLLANMCMIAGVSSLLMLAINPALFRLFLGGNYSIAYSAYKNMDLWWNIWSPLRNVGLIWIAAACAGVVSLLKRGEARAPCVRLLIAACITVILFYAVQDLGYHQHYLILPTILVFCGVFCIGAADFAIRKRTPVLVVLVLAACLVNFAFAYSPQFARIADRLEPITTAIRSHPQKNANYHAIRELVADLTKRIGTASEYVYVVGDGASLSPEILKRSYLPEQFDAAPYVLVNSIVDLRDGFPSQMFLADYVLTSDTLRTEFQTPQQVSVQVHDILLHDPGLASYYTRESTHDTANGELLLFRKTKPLRTAPIDSLRDRLRERYPSNPFVYEPNYFVALFQPDRGVEYEYNQWDDNSFKFNKKAGVPIIFRFQDTGKFSTLSFGISCWTPGLELIVENQNGVIFRSPVTQAEKRNYTMEVTGSEYLAVGVIDTERRTSVTATVIFHRPELR